jgi:hypothetical protein
MLLRISVTISLRCLQFRYMSLLLNSYHVPKPKPFYMYCYSLEIVHNVTVFVGKRLPRPIMTKQ